MASDPCLGGSPPALAVGVKQFNRCEFYDCHDTLEALWMAEPGPIRSLYQGILQIGVAFYHLEAGRYQPVVTLLERGSERLSPFSPTCMGLDIAGLLASAARCLSEVKRLGAEGLGDFDRALMPKLEMRNEK